MHGTADFSSYQASKTVICERTNCPGGQKAVPVNELESLGYLVLEDDYLSQVKKLLCPACVKYYEQKGATTGRTEAQTAAFSEKPQRPTPEQLRAASNASKKGKGYMPVAGSPPRKQHGVATGTSLQPHSSADADTTAMPPPKYIPKGKTTHDATHSFTVQVVMVIRERGKREPRPITVWGAIMPQLSERMADVKLSMFNELIELWEQADDNAPYPLCLADLTVVTHSECANIEKLAAYDPPLPPLLAACKGSRQAKPKLLLALLLNKFVWDDVQVWRGNLEAGQEAIRRQPPGGRRLTGTTAGNGQAAWSAAPTVDGKVDGTEALAPVTETRKPSASTPASPSSRRDAKRARRDDEQETKPPSETKVPPEHSGPLFIEDTLDRLPSHSQPVTGSNIRPKTTKASLMQASQRRDQLGSISNHSQRPAPSTPSAIHLAGRESQPHDRLPDVPPSSALTSNSELSRQVARRTTPTAETADNPAGAPRRLSHYDQPEYSKASLPGTRNLDRALGHPAPMVIKDIAGLRTYKVRLFPLTFHPLQEVLNRNGLPDHDSFRNISIATYGRLDVDVRPERAQYGSFKSAHDAQFRIETPAITKSAGFGPYIIDCPKLKAKRFIRQPPRTKKKAQGPTPPPGRFAAEQELALAHTELRALYYASALHDCVYVLMLNALKAVGLADKLYVPMLRFAATGVAMPESIVEPNEDPIWIIEETILGIFHKFINNNDVVPIVGLSGANLLIAIFLCFCQHVQFKMSEGRCVVADYQGSHDILTDPQLATTPEHSDHFGSGSISDVVAKFEERHVCNAWCDFFGIGQDGATPRNRWKPLRALGNELVCDPAYNGDSVGEPNDIESQGERTDVGVHHIDPPPGLRFVEGADNTLAAHIERLG
ncbi:hypothetical protein SISNIDRAFT_463480 [Sistotremastrum niveocremeum HHB9708]|uniref:Alpha-type protein kinase domain-containing protein n=1 Tax=Sistotremastrum niveocremeum HHB9708 TaxID=1314777 RepID=A0A164Y9K7_9AGAM|nr:hypothetical protein SISNIDRAFT_463480 [Sistotremastrum niveocremeum HHB9708]